MARRLGSTRKGEEKRAPATIRTINRNGSVGTIVLGVESHENELAFRLPFYYSVYSANSHRERERETARNKRDYRSLEAQ